MNRPVDILFQKIIDTKKAVFGRTGYKLHALKSAKEGQVVCFLNGQGKTVRVDIPETAYKKDRVGITEMLISTAGSIEWEDEVNACIIR